MDTQSLYKYKINVFCLQKVHELCFKLHTIGGHNMNRPIFFHYKKWLFFTEKSNFTWPIIVNAASHK
jgi:hypothetical protein